MIYSRADWGSEYPRGGNVINGPVGEVYVHHYNSGSSPPQTVADSMARVLGGQRYHAATQGWGDIGYSWLVDDLGNIFEGRGWWRTGAHTYGYNSKGYGICWLGDSNVSKPTHAALGAIAETVRMGISAGALHAAPTIVAHRDRVPDTSCCGDVMYAQLDEIRSLVAGRGPGRVNPPQLPTNEEDMMLYAFKLPNDETIWIRNPAKGTVQSVNDIAPVGADALTTYNEMVASGQCRPWVTIGWNANWAIARMDERV